jgi:cell division transport system permease protein
MSLWRALLYFLREAAVGLARSWKVSLVAVLTIAVSLLVGGTVLMVGSNLAQAVADWQREARLVVYLQATAGEGDLDSLRAALARPGWVLRQREVSPEQAVQRFAEQFPSLADLFAEAGPRPLPASLELEVAPESRQAAGFATWIAELRAHPAVAMVDDDRDWLAHAERLLGVVRAAGLALAVLLLGAAVFTIASVVRLISMLYRDEIAVLRLVGATEFFVRGPFYFEGMLQGLLGAILALATLGGAWLAAGGEVGRSASLALLFSGFLSWPACLLLLGLGPAAGLAGAVLSLQREEPGAMGRPPG